MQCKALTREYKYRGFSVQKWPDMPKHGCRWWCELEDGKLLTGFTRKEVFSLIDVMLDK